MPRYRLLLEYDGGAFHGWQMQAAVRSVQGEIERALGLLTRAPIRTAAAGRTDRGVHAVGQVVSFDAPGMLDPRRVIEGIHGICGPEIRVHRMEEAPRDFHARHSAVWREYRYRICLHPSALWRGQAWQGRRWPSLPALREATLPILGSHDFSACANSSPDEVSPLCAVQTAEWDCWEDGLLFTIRADRFLYKMVRTIVGTVVRESRDGGGGAARVAEILAARRRHDAGPPAPAAGLVLRAVGYLPPWP
jgi:tRNA pseudouridine38-40 synthase